MSFHQALSVVARSASDPPSPRLAALPAPDVHGDWIAQRQPTHFLWVDGLAPRSSLVGDSHLPTLSASRLTNDPAMGAVSSNSPVIRSLRQTKLPHLASSTDSSASASSSSLTSEIQSLSCCPSHVPPLAPIVCAHSSLPPPPPSSRRVHDIVTLDTLPLLATPTAVTFYHTIFAIGLFPPFRFRVWT